MRDPRYFGIKLDYLMVSLGDGVEGLSRVILPDIGIVSMNVISMAVGYAPSR